jgi:flagellar biosynthesis protein FlhG
MAARPIDIPRLHPTARTIAVTSGKGGAAKTTTAVALAARLAAEGHKVVLVDMDVPAPNAAIVAEVTNPKIKANAKRVQVVLPESPYGFRVVSPTSLESASYGDMVALPLWANDIEVLVYDLPGGWTEAQVEVMENFVDVVVAVTPPTPSALSDHAAHLRHLTAAVPTREGKIRDRDKRRKVTDLPKTEVLAVETLGYYTGTLPDGKVVTVRRLDAVPADEVEAAIGVEGAEYVGSIPTAPNVKALSETDEIGDLAKRVLA